MEQLAFPPDPPSVSVETCNGLFVDPWLYPVRQGITTNGRPQVQYRYLRGFGTAGTRTVATPVSWRRSRPFNLMPAAATHSASPQPYPSLRLLGQVFILAGLLAAALASWYMWGTGIITAGEQTRLSGQFQERLLATPDAVALPLGEEAANAALEVVIPVAWDNPVIQFTEPDLPALEPIPDLANLVPEVAPGPGEALGRIVIPKAEIDWIIVEGVTPEILRDGPGHVPGSAMPGQVGNTVISGHRTTNGAPFYNLDVLEPGDTITVETVIGNHEYEVFETRVVLPTDVWVATQWDGSWLTLTTCTPRFSSSNRLIVFARLVDGPNAAVIHARYGTLSPLASL